MPNDLRALLLLALRVQARGGPHSEAARQVVLAVLLAQLLADAGHEGPPHASVRPPRRVSGPSRRWVRESVAGRRPRG